MMKKIHLVKTVKILEKIVEIYGIKERIFFFWIYKMVRINSKAWGKCAIEIIIIRNKENKPEIWLNMSDIQDKLDVKKIKAFIIKKEMIL